VHTVVLFRAVAYATLFVGFVLVFLPAQVLRWAGVARPAVTGALEIAALIAGAAGAALALWCVLAFALVGKGTPAPFDPPRRLVARGPYRLVRNPMYLGAGLALAAAALFYQSLALLGFAAAFFLAAHLFVLWYEEPTLRRTFGDDYDAYRREVRRWWPRLRAHGRLAAARRASSDSGMRARAPAEDEKGGRSL
jgi:protein-S-isoprenylcysteine O-methyltransferase Ste14